VARTVAVLSDVHGVLPLLEAVLAEPDVQTADLVVVCGDHAAGPQPTAVLDRLRELIDHRGSAPVVLLRGNADRELAALARGEPVELGDDEVSGWAAARLGAADARWLEGLPPTATVEIDGFGAVLFCHATPRDDAEVVLVDSRPQRWAEVFAGLPDEIATVVCGHTHMPFARLVDGRLVVNPGSVGMPYGRPGAHWALLAAGAVSLRRTVPDLAAVAAAVIAGSTFPGRERWVGEQILRPPSDLDALAAFGPRDGRSSACPDGRHGESRDHHRSA
jgi:predicted phosphodiesterase